MLAVLTSFLLFAHAVPALPPGVSTLQLEAPIPQLDALAEEAEWIALGESIHRSAGFATIRAAMTLHLIQEHGFRVLAFESNWSPALKTDAWLHAPSGAPLEALDGLFGVWRDIPTLELLLALRDWNQHHPEDPVRVIGFDIQQPWADHQILSNVVGDNAVLSGVRADCPGADMLDAEAWLEHRAGWLASANFPACLASLAQARVALEALPDSAERVQGLLALRSLEGFSRLEEARARGADSEGTEIRDAAMAEVLLTSRDAFAPDAKVVVWAHNSHISWERTDVRLRPPRGWIAFSEAHINMGMVMTGHVGSSWIPIGLVAQHADTWFRKSPRISPKRSLEGRLAETGEALLWLDTRAGWKPTTRRILVGPMWGRQGIRQAVSKSFAGVIYVRYSERGAPLYLIQRLEEGERDAQRLQAVIPQPEDHPGLEEQMRRALVACGWEAITPDRWQRAGGIVTLSVAPVEEEFYRVQLTVESDEAEAPR